MPNYQVNSQPQQIFPFGEQEPMIIRNNGPYTVYIDSDPTVNTASHAIPPTGTMAWDGYRPLWIVADPYSAVTTDQSFSTVSIMRNSQPAVYSNDTDSIIWNTNVLVPDGSNDSATSPPVDCSAYRTLKMFLRIGNVSHAPGVDLVTERTWSVAVLWLDSNLNSLGIDSFTVPFPCTDTPNGAAIPAAEITPFYDRTSTVTVPVQGTYCIVKALTQYSGTLTDVDIQAVGMTRELPLGMTFTEYNGLPHAGGGVLIPGGLDYDSATSDSWATNDIPANNWPPLYLSSPKNYATLTFVSAEAVTVAGQIRFRNPYSSSLTWDVNVAIPVAGVGVTTKVTVKLPICQPIIMSFATIPRKAGPADLTNFNLTCQYHD